MHFWLPRKYGAICADPPWAFKNEGKEPERDIPLRLHELR